jgi:hypothetical protein
MVGIDFSPKENGTEVMTENLSRRLGKYAKNTAKNYVSSGSAWEQGNRV